MFGRSEKTQTAAEATLDKLGGKGRPTPSRKEAQAAAKERARAGTDKKAAAKLLRERRSEQNAKMRAGMKSGDERYLMERDKGPVRRFVRDYIDTRLGFMEFLLPVLVVIMVLQVSQVTTLQNLSSGLWSASILLLLVDAALLNFRLGREIKRRFPDDDARGWRFYAFMRAIQLRLLRMPKPQLKVRSPLPERYR